LREITAFHCIFFKPPQLSCFRYLIHNGWWPPHHHNRSAALDNKSAKTCRPGYPERKWLSLPLFKYSSNSLPLLTTGPASPSQFTRLRLGSLALRLASLLFGNSRPCVTTTPLPHTTGAPGQLPGRDFNPLDLLLLLRTGKYLCPSSFVFNNLPGRSHCSHKTGSFPSKNQFNDTSYLLGLYIPYLYTSNIVVQGRTGTLPSLHHSGCHATQRCTHRYLKLLSFPGITDRFSFFLGS